MQHEDWSVYCQASLSRSKKYCTLWADCTAVVGIWFQSPQTIRYLSKKQGIFTPSILPTYPQNFPYVYPWTRLFTWDAHFYWFLCRLMLPVCLVYTVRYSQTHNVMHENYNTDRPTAVHLSAIPTRGGFRHVQHVRPNRGPTKKGPPQARDCRTPAWHFLTCGVGPIYTALRHLKL